MIVKKNKSKNKLVTLRSRFCQPVFSKENEGEWERERDDSNETFMQMCVMHKTVKKGLLRV